MDAAFVFGNMGNIKTALGTGWSVEDEFAWAIGGESILTLPLPGNDGAYALRFDVHPAIFPPKILRQRLMIRAGKTVLGSFEMTARETISVALPPDVTTGAETLELTLIHPDSAKPRDHMPVDDSRRLSFCFHSATIARAGGTNAVEAVPTSLLEPVHGIVAGDIVAMRAAEMISKLPSLKGKFGVRFLNVSEDLEAAARRLPDGALDTAQFCWMELNAGTPDRRDAIRNRLPPACTLRTYYAPIINALWPFKTLDQRAVAEPGRYIPSRYPYGDRIALSLTTMNLPDDVLYLTYDMAANADQTDLDEVFGDDMRRWRAEGRKSDLQLANFIEDHLSEMRLFAAPNRPGPALMREIVAQILDDIFVRDIAGSDTILAELDELLEGYRGWREELPVHSRIAKHFKLSWWSPDMTYRWFNNRNTHRDYILDYIKWTQWRP